MQSIKGLALQSVISIEEAYIPFDGKFVCVTGHNRDSKISNIQNNASGKSTIFNAIANILYESDPMSSKKDRRALLKTSDAKIQLDLQDSQGRELTVLQTASKYFCQDAEIGDLKPHKIADAQNLIHEYFPITESEFYAYCYINGNKPFAFQHETESNRFNFLAKLFRLDIYDQVRNHVKKLREEAAKSVVWHDAIMDNIINLQKQLGENNWDVANDVKADKLATKMESLSDQSVEIYNQLAEMEANQKYATKRDSHERKVKRAKRIAKKYGVKFSSKQLKTLRALMKELDAYDDYLKDKRKYEKELATIELELKELGEVGDANALRKEFSTLSSKLDKLETTYEKSVANNKLIEKNSKRIAELEKKLKKFKSFDKKKAVKELNNLEQVIEIAEELGDHSECPTCGQSIDKKAIKSQAKKASSSVDKLNSKLDKLELYEELEELREDIKGLKVVDLKKAQKEINKIEKRLDEINDLGEASVRYTELQADLKSLKKRKPKKVSKPKTTFTADEVESIGVAINEGLEAKERLADIPVIEFDKSEYKKLKSALAELTSKIETTREKHVEYSVKKSQHYSLTEQLETANKELEKHKKSVERKKLYDTMYKLYGKELKGVAINDRLAALQEVMNENASLIFSEPMKFTFKADGTKIMADVLRHNGVSSDIRHLSGSESNCFRLLFAYSLLPILPSDRRTNFMILDEPDTACDDEVREHIIKNFVPHLKQAVPNVFWITPKDVDSFSDCEHWQVIKKNGLSSIKKVTMNSEV